MDSYSKYEDKIHDVGALDYLYIDNSILKNNYLKTLIGRRPTIVYGISKIWGTKILIQNKKYEANFLRAYPSMSYNDGKNGS